MTIKLSPSSFISKATRIIDCRAFLRIPVFLTAVFFYTAILTSYIQSLTTAGLPRSPVSAPLNLSLNASNELNPSSNIEFASQLFIFRRSRKTGGSSMLAAILSQLIPLGYTPLYQTMPRSHKLVRAEYVSRSPRKMAVLQHSLYSAVIADTVRDGYKQMTSYCRFVQNVTRCTGDEMLQCLNSSEAFWQSKYRWAGNEWEDEDTYIDLPLSPEHSSLSTTIFRKVFPNAIVHMKMFNAKESTCKESKANWVLYMKKYRKLDQQITMLRKRMLTLVGYPDTVDPTQEAITVEEMMNEVEKREQKKYGIDSSSVKADFSFDDGHEVLANTM